MANDLGVNWYCLVIRWLLEGHLSFELRPLLPVLLKSFQQVTKYNLKFHLVLGIFLGFFFLQSFRYRKTLLYFPVTGNYYSQTLLGNENCYENMYVWHQLRANIEERYFCFTNCPRPIPVRRSTGAAPTHPLPMTTSKGTR